MGFTKLDEGIVQSSVLDEDPVTFKVWIILLAMCKEDGIAYVSPVFLEKICRLTIDEIYKSIEILSSPDRHSRSSNDEGRRIRKVDMGYEIINYQRYRSMSLRSANAEKQRLYRARQKESCENVVTPGNESNAVTIRSDTSASISSSFSSSFLNWWKLYPRKLGKQDAAKAYDQAMTAGATANDLEVSVRNYCMELTRLGTEEKYIKHPATFLRADRWKDYLETRERPLQVGETRKSEKPAGYWDEVRRLKELGVEGERLTSEMLKWEAHNERTD